MTESFFSLVIDTAFKYKVLGSEHSSQVTTDFKNLEKGQRRISIKGRVHEIYNRNSYGQKTLQKVDLMEDKDGSGNDLIITIQLWNKPEFSFNQDEFVVVKGGSIVEDKYSKKLNCNINTKTIIEQINPNRKGWDGYKHLAKMTPDGLKLRIGFTKKLLRIFKKYKINYEWSGDLNLEHLPYPQKKNYYEWHLELTNQLWEHQQQIVKVCLKELSGKVSSPTGSGKTTAMAYLVYKLGISTNIYLGGKDCVSLGKQIYDNFCSHLGSQNIGFVGAGECSIREGLINIILLPTAYIALRSTGKIKKWNVKQKEDGSLEYDIKQINVSSDNYPLIAEVIERAELSIYDECDVLGASSYVAVSSCTKSLYNYGFSATVWRNDGRDMDIDSAIGELIYSITTSELIEKKILTPCEVHIYPVNVKDRSTGNLTYKQAYSNGIVNNEERNKLIVKIAKEFGIDKGMRGLIVVNILKHGKLLTKMLKEIGVAAVFVHGKHSALNRKRKINELIAKDLDVIITTLFSRGVNIPELDFVIRAKGEGMSRTGKPNTDVIQLVGRALRIHPNKKIAYIIDFFDHYHRFLTDHCQSRIMTYKSEKKFIVKNIVPNKIF